MLLTVKLTYREALAAMAALRYATERDHFDECWDRYALMDALDTFRKLPYFWRV